MKPKLLLCLALVLSGGLLGCSTASLHSAKSGLTCEVSVPSLKLKPDKTLSATMILKNTGSQPIRICTWGNPLRGVGPGFFDVTFMSGFFFSDAPPRKEFYKGVRTLGPSEILEIQFDIIAGTNTNLRITAHFESDTNFVSAELNCWHGRIDARPFTIKIKK